jgi:hypothetical protein
MKKQIIPLLICALLSLTLLIFLYKNLKTLLNVKPIIEDNIPIIYWNMSDIFNHCIIIQGNPIFVNYNPILIMPTYQSPLSLKNTLNHNHKTFEDLLIQVLILENDCNPHVPIEYNYLIMKCCGDYEEKGPFLLCSNRITNFIFLEKDWIITNTNCLNESLIKSEEGLTIYIRNMEEFKNMSDEKFYCFEDSLDKIGFNRFINSKHCSFPMNPMIYTKDTCSKYILKYKEVYHNRNGFMDYTNLHLDLYIKNPGCFIHKEIDK